MADTNAVDRSIGEYAYAADTPPRTRISPGASLRIETRDPRSGALLTGDPGTLQPYPPPPGGKSNALTGPVLVEGAQPGDVLKVLIDSLEPEPVGYMAAADLGYVVPEGEIGDRRVGIVSVTDNMVRFRPGIEFPARPMVGCLGVAHPDAPHSGAVGIFGGNFDHPVLAPGCTVFLPVLVPGAFFYIGDVHALMGDGELSCGGVEIGATVDLSVDLVRGPSLPAPRFETADRIITLGWDHDFAAARQMAVLDMLDLLERCLSLSRVEGLMLISAAADLRIGQACGNMEMTLRLEMPRIPGLTALPAGTG